MQTPADAELPYEPITDPFVLECLAAPVIESSPTDTVSMRELISLLGATPPASAVIESESNIAAPAGAAESQR
jgi:hypothetical protein